MQTTAAKTTLVAATVAAAFLLCSLPAMAQNLFSDGMFDTGIDSFAELNPSESAMSYDTLDLDGDPGSGSLELADVGSTLNLAGYAKGCVSVDLSAGQYYFEYWIRFASGETANGQANAFVSTYATSDCSGSPNALSLVAPQHTPAAGRGLWFRFRVGDITQGTTVPAGAKSFGIFLFVTKTSGPVLTANFDNFFFAPVGKPLCKGLVPTIGGNDGDDAIFGTDGPDVIVAFDGDDYVYGGDGADVVCGGAGDDTIYGEDGRDALFGQSGADTLFGDQGNDVLKGGPGTDILAGGIDKDLCIGGGGSDTAYSSCEKIKSVP